MPLQNRANPAGSIEVNPARGNLMGNRGVLHNSTQKLRYLFKSKAWITCLLEFKGRQRELMSPGLYTKLFFFDEVTAFAAGHRPCAECRRPRFNEFRDAWTYANNQNDDSALRAPQMDNVLHAERVDSDQKITWRHSVAGLPHGTMFQVGSDSYAVCDQKLLKWSFEGYSAADKKDLPETVDVLTPHSVVKVFGSGFRPVFHPTATS